MKKEENIKKLQRVMQDLKLCKWSYYDICQRNKTSTCTMDRYAHLTGSFSDFSDLKLSNQKARGGCGKVKKKMYACDYAGGSQLLRKSWL